MKLAEDILRNEMAGHPCCAFWTVPISRLAEREQAYFQQFMPSAQTAIALGHHVQAKEEWTWRLDPEGAEYCAADDHLREVCLQGKRALEANGFPAELVPYPGYSGLQFRYVALAAGAGELGTNVFLLHPQWGPWVHLRVMATEAPTEAHPLEQTGICTECDACLAECPSGAIQEASFDGLQCRSFRKTRGDYTPHGPRRELSYCETCADACPVGPAPTERT
ncbi:MAG: hypothetical protein K9K66_17320 [Desulfarculaceae bacterium]|nr:hypothetical protein [Desulfarculaceae bacterium]MCF8071450.1 hypothetical protein [Desulfarculaceae bacterium]MCF8103422.1 hypothetical protein [Desulfarculaceae bacterium]MCF8117837.1 hypothetical protein [Desulfarculaceae bacterium]